MTITAPDPILMTKNGLLNIIYESDEFIAIDKPSGILVHNYKEARGDKQFILQLLRDQVQHYLYPIHRLDRGTSGILIFAKNKEWAKILQASLSDPKTTKKYWALVKSIPPSSGTIDFPLKNLMDPTKEDKEALTNFKLLETFGEIASLVEVQIFTGRQHQIRRHFAKMAHQLIGDTTYGKGRINRYFRKFYNLNRIFLHCYELELFLEQGPIKLVTKLPQELEQCLNLLRQSPAHFLDIENYSKSLN